MLVTRRTMSAWCVSALVAALVTGCGGVSAVGGTAAGSGRTLARTATPSAAMRNGRTPASTVGSPGEARQPIWLDSLQMTSETTGWALYYSQNPNSAPDTSPLLLARTVDGGRTWTDVTPAAALPVLATFAPAQVLDPVDGEHAYFAVSAAPAVQGGGQETTIEFFTTADGGRTWTEAPPLRAQTAVSEVSFADPADGFLMTGGDGGSMGQDPVSLYRTADGGEHWSLAAATPRLTGATGTADWGPGQIPRFCDKYGLTFPTPTTGWISGTCDAGLAHTLLVTTDGGTDWSDASLPLPAAMCEGNSCTATGPQFTGGAGFLTVAPGGGSPALLVTTNLGQTWQRLALPAGAGLVQQITFVDPRHGILVPLESQGAFGSTFYTTDDGGLSWTPVPQGTHFSPGNYAIDFIGPRDGFAWSTDLELATTPPTTIGVTANSGRTWRFFTPALTG